jgi:hypothetical protein
VHASLRLRSARARLHAHVARVAPLRAVVPAGCIARPVIGCRLTQVTRIYNAMYDVPDGQMDILLATS